MEYYINGQALAAAPFKNFWHDLKWSNGVLEKKIPNKRMWL